MNLINSFEIFVVQFLVIFCENKDKCSNQLECQNNGYPNPKNCQKWFRLNEKCLKKLYNKTL